MEVGEVTVHQREVITYSVKVACANATITLNVDDMGVVRVMGHLSLEDQSTVTRFELAEFNVAYLRPVHAAIGAVLEAIDEDGEGAKE